MADEILNPNSQNVTAEVEPVKASAIEGASASDTPNGVSIAAGAVTDGSEPDDDLETEDSLTYSNGVIEKIVAMAAREVPHVLGMKGGLMHFMQEQFVGEKVGKGVSVEVTEDNGVVVSISVIIEYGAYAPDIFEGVKERVTDRLASMTGLEVVGINLRIEDVLTPEELADQTN